MNINNTIQQHQPDYPSTTPTGTNNSTDISNSKQSVPDNAINKQIADSNPQHGAHRLLNQSQIETVDSAKLQALPSTQQRCPENMMAHTASPHQPPAPLDEAHPRGVSTEQPVSLYFHFIKVLDKRDLFQDELSAFLMAAQFKDSKLFNGITSPPNKDSLLQIALKNNRKTAVITLVNTFQLFTPESPALYHLYCNTHFDPESFRRLLDYAINESNNLAPELLWPEPLRAQVINLLCWLGLHLRDFDELHSPYFRLAVTSGVEFIRLKIIFLFEQTYRLDKGIDFLSNLLNVTVCPGGDIKDINGQTLGTPPITDAPHFKFTGGEHNAPIQFKNILLWVCHHLGNTPMIKILLDCGAEVSADQLFGRDTSFTSRRIFMLAVECGNEDLARQINEKSPIKFPGFLRLINSGWWDKEAVKKSVIANDEVKNFFRCLFQQELETEPSLESDWAFKYCRTLANEEIIDTLIQTSKEQPDDIWATIKNRLLFKALQYINDGEQLEQWLNNIQPSNLDQYIYEGKTLLGEALHSGNHKAIEVLIRHGALRVNQQGESVFQWFLDGMRLLNKPTQLIVKCVVNALMTHHPNKGKKLLNQPVAKGHPLLYWAIEWGCIEIIDTLLTHGASPDLDIGHTTAFHSLAKSAKDIGDERVLEIYRNMTEALNNDKRPGAQPLNFYLDKPDNREETPLALAMSNKRPPLVECLAEDTTNFTVKGETVFHLLGYLHIGGSGHGVLLLKALINGINKQHRYSKSYLGELLNQPDDNGIPPLADAKDECIDLLLSNGAELSFPSGATIFHYSAANCPNEHFGILVTAIEKAYGKERAQKILRELLNKKDARGNTPIDCAKFYRHKSSDPVPKERVQDYISMLQKHGAK